MSNNKSRDGVSIWPKKTGKDKNSLKKTVFKKELVFPPNTKIVQADHIRVCSKRHCFRQRINCTSYLR